MPNTDPADPADVHREQPMDPDEQRNAKLAALTRAVENYQSGSVSGLFDEQAEKHKAEVRAKALTLLDHRMRTVHEMRTRLLGYDFAPELVDEVVTDLMRTRLLDDAIFAEEWVRQRHRRGKSRLVLNRELADKGVSASIREDALETISENDERAVAEELAAKKARSISVPPADYGERQKMLRRIVGVLARRGYPQAMSMSVAIAALDLRLEELAEQAADDTI